MGSFGSVPADNQRLSTPVILHPKVASLSNAPVSVKTPAWVSSYVDTCRCFSGVVGLGEDRDSNGGNSGEWFRLECQNAASAIHRMFLRKGQRKYVARGVFFYVLLGKFEVKQFTAHMKGLELVQFLRLPDVTVPETALTRFMGMHIACVRILYLHRPIYPLAPSQTSTAANAAPSSSALAWSSRQAAVVRIVIGKVLRLQSNDVALVMYECGDGRLVVVDATWLLPRHTLAGAEGPGGSVVMRSEYLIGRDLGNMTATPSVIVGTVVAPKTSAPASYPDVEPRKDMPQQSFLAAVLASSVGSKKRLYVTPVLNALVALQSPSTAILDDQLTVAGSATVPTTVFVYETQCYPATPENAALTSHLLLHVLPSLMDIFENLPDDMGQSEFVALLHLAGINVTMLGELHLLLSQSASPQTTADARARVAVEMVSRAAKHWLQRQLLHQPTDFEGQTLTLLRGIAEFDFFTQQLQPIIVELFSGSLSASDDMRAYPAHAAVPFRAVMERVQQLTGMSVTQGKLKSIAPVVRLARRDFTFSSSDETSICAIAAKRVDGMAGAALFAAASWWANNPNRLAKIVDQLHHKVSSVQQNASSSSASEGAYLTQLFFTELQFMLSRMIIFRLRDERTRGGAQEAEADQRKRFDYVHSIISNFIPSMVQLYQDCPHDRLHVTREVLPLIDFQLKDPNTLGIATQSLRVLLQLSPLTDASHYHIVASRNLADELYKLSIEACMLTKQHDEALIVAQRWFKLCPQLFCQKSKQQCRAAKLLLSALVLSHSPKTEQIRVAKIQLQLCEGVFGKRDVKTATAASELGSLTWKAKPSLGLQYFRRSLDIYRESLGPVCRPVCTALYNIGLALARLNKFRAALSNMAAAKVMATQLNEVSTARMCQVSEQTVFGVAALKIQRWYRELRYGQAQSQTTKTDVTTKCSTLSWSDERDEIASSVNE